MNLKFDMMRCFRIVAERGTLASAAKVLGRTPSAISMTLRQLEEILGAPLFESDRKNQLTPFGLRVLEEANRAVDAFDRSLLAIKRHALSSAGTVRIAAVPSAAETVLPDVLIAYRELRPQVRLEISDVDSAGVVHQLQFDMADIGIASTESEPGITAQPLCRDRLGIICRRDCPMTAPGLAPSWNLLQLAPFIGNPLASAVDHPAVRSLTADSTLTVRNTTTLLSFVRSGLGATILPQRALNRGDDELAFIAPDDPASFRSLQVLRSSHRHLSPAAEALRRILLELYAES